ncbi:hypothetical protein CIL05_09755 [Virgibacillus profundi]|uniref:Uncharacterized protein n=1 Tax=Virgibacillus profundi TaxID=2024555 RepID=A0A2A2IE55_9BACI|nr:hypothetical protein [Virgibacillus profundi]PAV29648.1 hypothetical protein CIL05_09755 [Virgibacillus profundi]PXY53820.1 hypothetical protein CIT14_09850 [Virgibacillus profundi]
MKTQTSNLIYFPDKTQEKLFEIFDDVFSFSVNQFYQTILESMEEMISNMNISDELSERIFPQLVWWIIFCSRTGKNKLTIYQQYLQHNKNQWKKISPNVQEVLVSWLHLNPGYYYVDNTESKSGRVFLFNDVFEGKNKVVGIYNKRFQAPKYGQLITGFLLPIGEGIYTTPGGLFHIPKSLTENIDQEIVSYFKKHSTSPNYQFNPQLYPTLIKITLETLEKYTQGGFPNE